MSIKTKSLTGLALVTLLAVNLMTPSLVHAGKGAGKGHHHHRHYQHQYQHQHHHYYGRHDHRRHSGGHVHIYNQVPPAYYRQYYPQPQQYGYYPPVPAPVYVVPPQMMMGINTGKVDFMLRF